MTMERWEHFQHNADIGIRGFGATREAALTEAALAAVAVIADPATVRAEKVVEIECEEPDNGLLLADWINALVYEMARRHMLFGRFEVRLNGHHLSARAWGEKVDFARHTSAMVIKRAIYTDLRMEATDEGGWLAQCVVDV